VCMCLIVVVGTPGRVAQLMVTGVLQVHRTPLQILDEVRVCVCDRVRIVHACVHACVGEMHARANQLLA
jgi:hypothetical protein